METSKLIDANVTAEEEKAIYREYTTPVLEEFGDLHSLTHGTGTVDFDGGEPGYLNFG